MKFVGPPTKSRGAWRGAGEAFVESNESEMVDDDTTYSSTKKDDYVLFVGRSRRSPSRSRYLENSKLPYYETLPSTSVDESAEESFSGGGGVSSSSTNHHHIATAFNSRNTTTEHPFSSSPSSSPNFGAFSRLSSSAAESVVNSTTRGGGEKAKNYSHFREKNNHDRDHKGPRTSI